MIRVPLRVVPSHPKRSSPIFVELNQESLPADANQIVMLLTRETASIEYWLEIAVSLLTCFTLRVCS